MLRYGCLTARGIAGGLNGSTVHDGAAYADETTSDSRPSDLTNILNKGEVQSVTRSRIHAELADLYHDQGPRCPRSKLM